MITDLSLTNQALAVYGRCTRTTEGADEGTRIQTGYVHAQTTEHGKNNCLDGGCKKSAGSSRLSSKEVFDKRKAPCQSQRASIQTALYAAYHRWKHSKLFQTKVPEPQIKPADHLPEPYLSRWDGPEAQSSEAMELAEPDASKRVRLR